MGGPSIDRLEAPVSVHAVGSGGVDEVRACLLDAEVAWVLLRMEVGSGPFARTKFIAVHFNGEDVPVVQRGRLNSRKADVLAHFGEVHATLEFNRQEEFTIDAVCEELLPILTSDSNLGGGLSAKSLKEAYEEVVMKQQKASSFKCGAIRSIPRTARECNSGRRMTARDALTAVTARRGLYNWVLLEPTKLELHNAGYGGLEELKAWLEDDKVFFGLIRFSFGNKEGDATSALQDCIKYVFVHWVGPSVPAVRRGQWNTQLQAADTLVHQACTVVTLRKEVHTPDDLNVAEIVSELRRLSVINGTSDGAARSISVEEYMAALNEECQAHLQADRSEAGEEAAPQALPDVRAAVEAVRKAGEATWNWLLVGLGPRAPALGGPSLAQQQRCGRPPPTPRDEPVAVSSERPTDLQPEAAKWTTAAAASIARGNSLPAERSSRVPKVVPKGNALVTRVAPPQERYSLESVLEPGGSSRGVTTKRSLAPAAPHAPAWEVMSGTLRLRTGWWWSRRHFELRAGRLRWWRRQEDFEREADPLDEIALVKGEKRWQIEHVGGAQLELICHRSGGAFRGGHHIERYMLMGDDERDASEWAEAIGQHIRYVDMLLCFPLPLEGRQGDVRNYGISYPDAVS